MQVAWLGSAVERFGRALGLGRARGPAADADLQAQLRDSEERLRLAASAARFGTWDIDLTSGIGRRDAMTLELSGLPPDAALFNLGEWVSSVHAEDRPAFIAARDAALAPGGPNFHAEFRLADNAGPERWLIIDGQVIREPQTGRPLRAVGVLRDVTAQRQAEDDLRRSEARLRAILETLPIGVIVRAADNGRVLFANRAVKTILGRPAAPALDPEGRAFAGAFHADGRAMAPDDAPIMQVLSGGPARDTEVRYVRSDGSAVWLRVIAAPLYDEDDVLLGGVVAFVDIDEQRGLVEHQQLLVAELSHRVKNALAVVQGLASATLRRSTSLPEFANAFEGRLQALGVAHSLLLRSNWRGLALDQLVAAVLNSFVETDDRIAAEGPPVELDAKQGVGMALILHELATNAVKYGVLAAGAGRISIAWRRLTDVEIELTWREAGVALPGEAPPD